MILASNVSTISTVPKMDGSARLILDLSFSMIM